MFRQVLVPVEFSVCGRAAARHACDVIRAIGGNITLLHVLEGAQQGRVEGRDRQLEEAQTQLQLISGYARRPPGCVIVPAVDGVAPVILRVAADMHAQLIMLGLHSQDGPGQHRLGSVVRQVLLGAGVPVQVTPCHMHIRQSGRGWPSFLTGP